VNAPIGDLHPANALTYLALGASLGAVAAAGRPGGLPLAGLCLAIAALCDTFDGRFARLFRRSDREARAGAALDSLVDAVAFGLTPVVVLRALADDSGGVVWTAWWMAAFAYVLAAVTRLAFFDAEADHTRFVGLPMPAVALVCATLLLPALQPLPALVVPVVLMACAAAMVAPIPIPRPRGPGLAAFALWAVALGIAFGRGL
jgi:CDP-diacylglycerol--serine O-phosphatidyltransferase